MPPVVPAVSKLTVRLPERFTMLPLLLNVPKTFIFVSDHVLAALVVSVPFVSTSTEPSIERLVAEPVPPLKPSRSRPPPPAVADAEVLCENVEVVSDVNVPTQGQGSDTRPEP